MSDMSIRRVDAAQTDDTPSTDAPRCTPATVLLYSQKTYDSEESLVTTRGKFRVDVVTTRNVLERTRAVLRDAMKPYKDKEAALSAELARLDALIVDTWDKGVRSSDNSLEVLTKPEQKRWSLLL